MGKQRPCIRTPTTCAAATLALAATLAVPLPASGGTVELLVEKGAHGRVAKLRFVAAAGERNALVVRRHSTGPTRGYTIRERRLAIQAGTNCVLATARSATCSAPDGVRPAGGVIRLGDRSDFARSRVRGIAVLGGPGHDDLAARGPLFGGSGADSLEVLSALPRTEVRGGPGHDALFGGPGPDVLIGGPGTDFFDSGAGDDLIRASDASAEEIFCGAGADSVLIDGSDYVAPIACDRALRTGAARAAAIEISATTGEGEILALVNCPRDAAVQCRGEVVLSRRGRRIGRERFRARRGGEAFVPVAVPDAVVDASEFEFLRATTRSGTPGARRLVARAWLFLEVEPASDD